MPHRRRPTRVHRGRLTGDVGRAVGQMIVARFAGRQPPRQFLARVESGQVGGVILFADNLSGGLAATRALIEDLQHAAQQGDNPPLVIMTDQEGGTVRRLPGPPDLAPSAMSSDSIAFAQGQATGRLLRGVGINVDLAPVADVERAQGSFLGTRSFGDTPEPVAARACAFARGLSSQDIAFTLKHFPGLGRALESTDNGPVSIDIPAEAIRDDYLPYLTCASSPLAIVMVSSAIYPALTGPLPAVMSPLTYDRELRIAVPDRPVLTISDDLQAPALADQTSPARQAIEAGLDLAMYAQTEEASTGAYQTLLTDVRHGQINPGRVRAAAHAIETLKRTLTAR
jgi:beta-N-acetylhexosaminidase